MSETGALLLQQEELQVLAAMCGLPRLLLFQPQRAEQAALLTSVLQMARDQLLTWKDGKCVPAGRLQPAAALLTRAERVLIIRSTLGQALPSCVYLPETGGSCVHITPHLHQKGAYLVRCMAVTQLLEDLEADGLLPQSSEPIEIQTPDTAQKTVTLTIERWDLKGESRLGRCRLLRTPLEELLELEDVTVPFQSSTLRRWMEEER